MIIRLLLALALALVIAGSGAAQEKKASPEQRLAAIEKTLSQLLQDVQSLREEMKAGDERPGLSFKIYTLKNGDAASLARILQGVLSGVHGPQANATRFVADPRTNSLIVTALPDVQQLVEALIQRLDGPAMAQNAQEPPAARIDWETRLKELEAEVEVLTEKAEWSKRMVEKGFTTAAEARKHAASAERARALLKAAQDEYRAIRARDKGPSPEKPAK